MRTNDMISGAVMIALAVAMIILTLHFPPFPGQDYGPALFPRVLATGLILTGTLLVARGIKRRRAGEPLLTLAAWTADRGRLASFLLIPALIVGYVLVSEQIGFLPVAFVLLLGLMLWFRTRLVVALPIAVVAAWGIHYFFATLMRVPLPRGLLTDIL
ncbi:MAG: tripartite tricarboxylate transporter TctB family protein [Hyphomicrobiaceae bacterium]